MFVSAADLFLTEPFNLKFTSKVEAELMHRLFCALTAIATTLLKVEYIYILLYYISFLRCKAKKTLQQTDVS